ncbi:glycoside hydrolase family 13 protein [Candidatus Xianfuyuplasma coldseepsis]|uniref:Alpha-amylase n=1 Tax=Candidatus Xianfuyuplasma coldseepsis TaxID=2782163 RepID=A0A7L7KTE6_9MOLU|nr:alpha-glucosidase [Xianfuyuplasma coldseepsis]QMS85679.1 alpha-glucosidase [Xianfuyuplasma coldseepsis]
MNKAWWQDAVIYQCYIRSFYDANGDGIGDFRGLIDKLQHFIDLGVDAVWVSPHYKSPMDDNGYDVSDYYQVSDDYGTLEDVKEFIARAHQHNIKVIFDLVLNHTSDEHPWFQAACDPNHPEHERYHDYYIWQPPKYDADGNRIKPTKWLSWFGGGVWDYNEPTDEYYLHIFSKKMPDLNWRNEAMKNDLKAVTKWLIDLGVDGFRVDASNHLEKNWDFPDAYPGYEHFSSLPKHHEYLEEFGRELFRPNNVMTMGEAGGASKEEAEKYVGYDHDEFNMLIQFGHCWQDCDWTNQITTGKWAKGDLNVVGIKESFAHFHDMLKGIGHNLIYWHNHDQPRVVSHYGNDQEYWKKSALMLLYTLYFMPGTAIVYQGEEIGMINVDYTDLSDFRDVEVFTEYDNFRSRGASHEYAMQALRDRSRDNARSPFQWSSEPYAGFSTTIPWMNVVGSYPTINLAAQQTDPTSIFNQYKTVFSMRKKRGISDGTLTFIELDHPDHYCYTNKVQEGTILVIANFRNKETLITLDMELDGYEELLSNCQQSLQPNMILQPYDAIVYFKKE